MNATIYSGHVMHQRLQPFRHRFVYRVFSLYLDIDALPELDLRSRLFGVDRRRPVSFHTRDHGARDGSALRPWVETWLDRAGIVTDGGPIRMLFYPRILGYAFNPLSIYFCFDRGEHLRAILYDVRNTFGGKHGYLVPIDPDTSRDGTLRHSVDKRFHVSPFIDMDATYHFRIRQPAARVSVGIRETDRNGDLLVATFTGKATPLNDRNLIRALLRTPFMTYKVIAGIHWEALKLFIKGARFRRGPEAPADAVSLPGAHRPGVDHGHLRSDERQPQDSRPAS